MVEAIDLHSQKEGKIMDVRRLALPLTRIKQIQQFAVTAEQMRQIEGRVFAAGMPVAALMEKVGRLLVQRLLEQDLLRKGDRVGILVGSGHNGGDALVMARELHLSGYEVLCYQPLTNLKDLTAAHSRYADSLGIAKFDSVAPLQTCDLIIDGLFGFGLTQSLEGNIAHAVQEINQWQKPTVSLDLPSGVQTDTGAVLGTAIRATHTFCLGLWKLAFLQDQALEYLGKAELIDFGIPLADIHAVLGANPLDSAHHDRQRDRRSAAAQTCLYPQISAGALAVGLRVTALYGSSHSSRVCGSG